MNYLHQTSFLLRNVNQPILLALFLLLSIGSFSQTNLAKPSVQDTSSKGSQEPASRDSFEICGLRFSTFRDCVDGSWRNCCSYYTEPTYVTCTDKGALMWSSMPSIEIAEMNIKNHLADLLKQGKKTTLTEITCEVLGYKGKAYHVKHNNSDGSRWSDIRMAAIVNGQAILLELHLIKPVVTNKQIPPVFRQILTVLK